MLIDVIEKTLPFHLPECQSFAAVDIFILLFPQLRLKSNATTAYFMKSKPLLRYK